MTTEFCIRRTRGSWSMSLRLNTLLSIFKNVCLFAATLGLLSAWATIPTGNVLYTFESGSPQGFYFHDGSTGNNVGHTPTKPWDSPSTTVATVGWACCSYP